MLTLNRKPKDTSEQVYPAPNGNVPLDALSSKPLIEARNLTKVYQTGAGGFTALKNINLEVYPGEFLVVVGKSGAGKTTLLNTLSGVSEITSGQVWYRSPSGGIDREAFAWLTG